MFEHKCPRCRNLFFSAVSIGQPNCPFCGFTIKPAGKDPRAARRSAIQRECVVLDRDISIPARANDISESGVGVTLLNEPVFFGPGETLRVVIKDFDIDSPANVVWLKRVSDSMSKAGLRFSGPG
jgi:hypothetical protein